ncbi:MFS transporter [Methylovirgula sp. HY1]|uniref:MFS transporter n=1 Tax=Methylovirgula sp. HY1 TaxID=2822761 RepID=UPI001C5ADC2E|nr:MFS transporter [Methylovirgula sp. HY1]
MPSKIGDIPALLNWRLIPGSVVTLGFVSLFMDISSEMIHSLLPLYLVVGLGTSTVFVGLIEGMADATTSLVKIFSGVLSDRAGKRKWLAAAGYGLSALSKPMFPLAPSVGWILFARLIDRAGKGIRGAPRDALITDLTPEKARGAAFGLRQSLDTIGAVLGPLLAILLMEMTSGRFTVVFWIAVVPAVLSFALIAMEVKDEAVETTRETQSSLSFTAFQSLPQAYWMVVAIGTLLALARFSEVFLVLRAKSDGLSESLSPLVMLVMSIVFAIVAWPAGALSDRYGRYRILAVGIAVFILANLLLGFVANVAATLIGGGLWGLQMGLTQGLMVSLVADKTPSALRGTGFGIFSFLTGLTTFFATLTAGALWAAFGPAATFGAGGGLALLTLIVMAILRPWRGG